MDRLLGSAEALSLVRRLSAIEPPAAAFDPTFSSDR